MLAGGAQSVYAVTWRVNNNLGVSHDFTSIQAAVDAAHATNGDTIHVEGSVTPYDPSGVLITKRVVILGPGYHLTVNPETQHQKPSARVHNITFNTGSEGSVLAGIEQQEVFTNGIVLTPTAGATVASIAVAVANWGGPRLIIGASNITIVNCKLNWVEIRNDAELSNIDIRKSWFCPGIVRTTGTEEVLNLNLVNNFFRNDGAASGYVVIDLHASTKANIVNNTFYGGFVVHARSNCRISNNVFYGVHARAATNLTTHVSNTYMGNISNIDLLGGMINGQNSNTIRVTEATEALSSTWFMALGSIAAFDRYFRANTGATSPIRQAASAANVQGELGMYGGLAPYALSGLTNIPAIYEIVMPSEVSADGFEVTVRVRAH